MYPYRALYGYLFKQIYSIIYSFYNSKYSNDSKKLLHYSCLILHNNNHSCLSIK